MIIYPAIDLIGGAVVRLHKGDFDQLTTYGDNPVSVAQSYADAGATWLHLVDLDGAKNPDNRQIDLIAKIINSTGLKVQTGGGIRSFADVQALVNAGASRIVIGSLAVRDPEAIKTIFKAFGPEKICLAADVIWQNNGLYIAVSGWQEASSLSLFDFIETYQQDGLLHALCTDINRDGAMQGPNLQATADLANAVSIPVIASGGVSSIADLQALKSCGAPLDGAISGRALYDGAIDLGQALQVMYA